jgi:GrpB-like predicted nucleotidyltransferase (UPF0157 family)
VAGLTFVLSNTVAEEAAAAFAEHVRLIRTRLACVEIRHTGGTSVLGVLTSGDVDLHVRAAKQTFASARDVLRELYEPLYPDAWHDESAYFFAAGSAPPVEVALTVIGTLDDLHHGEAWQQIAADPELIRRYNAMKRAHQGGSRDHYTPRSGSSSTTTSACRQNRCRQRLMVGVLCCLVAEVALGARRLWPHGAPPSFVPHFFSPLGFADLDVRPARERRCCVSE